MYFCIKSSTGTQNEVSWLYKCFKHPGSLFCDPGVSLTLCCFVVYSTRLFVLYLTLCYFVLVFFSPFSIVITSLGERELILVLFVRFFFRFALVWFCLFPLPLGVWEGLRFVIVALPGLFSFLFYHIILYSVLGPPQL